ncbi:MAG TPA: hypothetical protein VMB35_06885, partial [Methanomicrobiales archaeon]|nr:hypothetical protein [Methanomicrobiales archaeon]
LAVYKTSKSNIQSALKAVFGSTPTTATTYPCDAKDTNSLARGLFYLTKGAPTPIENDFITFAASPASCDAMHTAGVFCNADLA